MRVSEIFGPTIQGEGPSSGRVASFVRLMGCNLSCSWCDTPWTWDATRFDLKAEGRTMSPLTVATDVPRTPLVVITGGEPTLQRADLDELVGLLIDRGQRVEIETNGSQPWQQLPAGARYNVSPKLLNAGMGPTSMESLYGYANDLAAAFKFVVQSVADLDEVSEMVSTLAVAECNVWVMPEGTTAEDIQRHGALVADVAIQRGFNVTTRQHVMLWGNTRGR